MATIEGTANDANWYFEPPPIFAAEQQTVVTTFVPLPETFQTALEFLPDQNRVIISSKWRELIVEQQKLIITETFVLKFVLTSVELGIGSGEFTVNVKINTDDNAESGTF